jgi:hypothetical protein
VGCAREAFAQATWTDPGGLPTVRARVDVIGKHDAMLVAGEEDCQCRVQKMEYLVDCYMAN